MNGILTVLLAVICAAMLIGSGKTGSGESGNGSAPENSLAAKMDIVTVSENEIMPVPLVKVNGRLYYDSGETGDALRCSVMDGEIRTSVDESRVPGENDESNFGSGFSYQYGINDTLEVEIDGKMHIFKTD